MNYVRVRRGTTGMNSGFSRQEKRQGAAMVKTEKCVCDLDGACCKDGEGVSGAREGRGQIR